MNSLLLAVGLTVVCQLAPVLAQELRPRSFCQGNELHTFGPCSRNYTRCDNNMMISGFCVGQRYVNSRSGRCEERPTCGTPNRPNRRGKRQAVSRDPSYCPEPRFDCPSNVVFYIYPDWNDCTQFYTCSQGSISTISCNDYNYQYYNPDLFSCEVDRSFGLVTPQDNVCVNRAGGFQGLLK